MVPRLAVFNQWQALKLTWQIDERRTRDFEKPSGRLRRRQSQAAINQQVEGRLARTNPAIHDSG